MTTKQKKSSTSLMLLLLPILVAGCSSERLIPAPPPLPPRVPVEPLSVPLPVKPSICIPNCSANQANDFESWLASPMTPTK